ncbi:MAG: hypothetical protein NVS4B11_05900 [Ktedonobacteraceae bacterium]
MAQTTPGPKLARSHIAPVRTREELIYLLSRAAELEHGLACIYLFAAYSLKNDASEGDMTEEQAAMVRDWRRHLNSTAVEEMGHLAQVSNLLTAIGGAPHFKRTNLPMPPEAYPFGIRLSLEPFSQETIERFVCYEMPEMGILSAEQQALFDPILARVFEGQGAMQVKVEEEDAEENFEPFEVDFKTIGELYHKIETGFTHIPEEELFIGPPEAQANARFVDLKGNLISIVDRASACAAIEVIVEQGEAPTTAHPDSHFWVFDRVRIQYAEAQARAEQTGVPFEPVRPVVSNPMTHFYDDTSGGIVIRDPFTHEVADLFNVAYDTMLLMLLRFFAHTEETDAELEHLSRATLRLMTTVIRPLGEVLTKMPVDRTALPGRTAGPGFGYNRDVHLLPHKPSAWVFFGERLWQLATVATKLRLNPDIPTEFQEATAALQDLACQFAPSEGPHGVAAKVAELKQMQAELGCSIQASLNGPYLVTNADTLVTWLGERIPAQPQMALCRCGGSAIKPFCDGTHVRIGFTGQKDSKRVPNRRDTYVGQQVTVLDNRGLCAHSGFCTDRLASVFHAGQEPFVTPSGARMDEIIRAVRACPSGALSYAIDGVEARNQVDQERQPTIEVSKDGPYRLTGGIPLKDGQGSDEPRNAGASWEHYSLCRCGHSQNKPFCSGMHWYVNFHDPVADPDHEPTVFEWAGGLPALTRLTRLFYEKYVPQDPLIGPLFANMSPDHPERVAAWLGEVFGGPESYSKVFGGYSHMISQHVGKCLTEAQRARWVSLLCQSADEVALPADAEFRAAFVSYIEWGSRLAVENSQTDSHPPEHMPMPHWWWVCNATPGARVSALIPQSEGEQEPVVLPTPDASVSFKTHIKPLFRSMDRQSMKFVFDLWSYQDVRNHADGILQRLQNGSMPCDGAWPHEKVETFQRWVESGKLE